MFHRQPVSVVRPAPLCGTVNLEKPELAASYEMIRNTNAPSYIFTLASTLRYHPSAVTQGCAMICGILMRVCGSCHTRRVTRPSTHLCVAAMRIRAGTVQYSTYVCVCILTLSNTRHESGYLWSCCTCGRKHHGCVRKYLAPCTHGAIMKQ